MATMDDKKFSIAESIGFGWTLMKSNIGFLLLVFIAVIFYAVISSAIIEEYLVAGTVEYFALSFLQWLGSMLLSMGILKISLKLHDGDDASFSDLFSSWELLINYILVQIVSSFLILLGLFLLIIPGIILAVKFSFAGYFVVDKGLNPIEALRKSAAITKGVKWDLLGLYLVIGCINLVGFVCLVVGLLITIPITWLALAFVYRKLLTRIENTSSPDGSSMVFEG